MPCAKLIPSGKGLNYNSCFDTNSYDFFWLIFQAKGTIRKKLIQQRGKNAKSYTVDMNGEEENEQLLEIEQQQLEKDIEANIAAYEKRVARS